MKPMLRTTAVLIGATGATLGAAYRVLSLQERRARRNIVIPRWAPFRADGVYLPEGTSRSVASLAHCPVSEGTVSEGTVSEGTVSEGTWEVLRLAMLGDSLAAGLGADGPEHLPGVVLARGLAAGWDSKWTPL